MNVVDIVCFLLFSATFSPQVIGYKLPFLKRLCLSGVFKIWLLCLLILCVQGLLLIVEPFMKVLNNRWLGLRNIICANNLLKYSECYKVRIVKSRKILAKNSLWLPFPLHQSWFMFFCLFLIQIFKIKWFPGKPKVYNF